MALGIGAQGAVGIAFEATTGTYVIPTKWFPYTSESLKYDQKTTWRRVIRGVADNLGEVQGFFGVEGDLEMELMEDALPYFLYVSRNSIVKSGATDFTYTTTPIHAGAAGKTGSAPLPKPSMTIHIERAGIVFAYVGCIVTSMEFSVKEGVPMMKFHILGFDEAVQTVGTKVYLATSVPFSPGQYNIQVPTATQVYDVDNFTFSVNDNGESQWRLSDRRRPEFHKFGEREVSCSMERDFDTRTEYDAFKALTSSTVQIDLTKSAVKKVTLKLTRSIRETYELGGTGAQGDLIRASVNFMGTYDSTTSKAYEIVVICQESIV